MKIHVGYRVLLVFACCLALVSAPAYSLAAPYTYWTTAGSTGTVDEADTALINFNGPTARVKPAAVPPVTVDIRYNVVALEAMFWGDNIQMTVRYLDNGDSAKVIARLKQMNLTTGVVTTVLTFNSDSYASSADYQTRTVLPSCVSPFTFQFDKNVYFIEVELTKSAAGGDAALQGIQISYSLC